MRTGHIDFDTGKWVDDPPGAPSYKTISTASGSVHIPQAPPAPVDPSAMPAPAPAPLPPADMSLAGKARMIQERRKSITGGI